MEEQAVTLPNILVVRESEFGWFCEHEGRPLFVAQGQVALHAPVPAVGTRGTIEVHAFAAYDLGLVNPARGQDSTA